MGQKDLMIGKAREPHCSGIEIGLTKHMQIVIEDDTRDQGDLEKKLLLLLVTAQNHMVNIRLFLVRRFEALHLKPNHLFQVLFNIQG